MDALERIWLHKLNRLCAGILICGIWVAHTANTANRLWSWPQIRLSNLILRAATDGGLTVSADYLAFFFHNNADTEGETGVQWRSCGPVWIKSDCSPFQHWSGVFSELPFLCRVWPRRQRFVSNASALITSHSSRRFARTGTNVTWNNSKTENEQIINSCPPLRRRRRSVHKWPFYLQTLLRLTAALWVRCSLTLMDPLWMSSLAIFFPFRWCWRCHTSTRNVALLQIRKRRSCQPRIGWAWYLSGGCEER